MFTLIERTNYGDGKMCPYQEEEYDTKYEMKLADNGRRDDRDNFQRRKRLTFNTIHYYDTI